MGSRCQCELTLFTDLIAASPPVLLLVVILGEEVAPVAVVRHPGVVELVGVAGDVVLEPGQPELGALVTAAGAGLGGHHDPGEQRGSSSSSSSF